MPRGKMYSYTLEIEDEMSSYQPPFSLTDSMLTLVQDIESALERLKAEGKDNIEPV